MFTLETSATGMRLVAHEKLSADDFREIARQLKTPAVAAHKTGMVAAYPATTRHTVETYWNGKETQASAEPGDMLVTSLDAEGLAMRDAAGAITTYVIKPAKFAELYAPTERVSAFGNIFEPRAAIETLYLPGGFDIIAPWGEPQRCDTGYLLLNGNDVYGHSVLLETTIKFHDAS